jgi:hypothetical protein
MADFGTSAKQSSPEIASRVRWRRPIGIEACLFLLLLLCYCWPIDLDPGANVYAHMDQSAAIVSSGTLWMDAFMRPPDGPNTVDWSRAPDGHIYPTKAPGCAFAAVPLMAALYYGESAIGIAPFQGDWFRRNIVLVNWVLNSLASAVAMTLLLRIVIAAGVGMPAAVLGVLSIALGTAYYPYATTYYAHNLAANLIIVAALLVFSASASWKRDALVGLLAGFAVAFDYAAVLGVLVFAAVLGTSRPKALAPFVAGGLVPLAFLAWYHTVVFGGPTITAYRYMNPKIAPPDGELLRLPRLGTLIALTFSPYRGILFYSPVLLLAAAGAWCAARGSGRPPCPSLAPARGQNPQAIVWSGVVLFGLLFLFNACYYVWWGGWTAGSRYIVPGLVLLAPAIAIGFATFPRLGVVLLAISIANHVAITSVLIMVNDDVRNPLVEVIYPLLWRGDLQRSNLGVFLLGLKGLWSLAALVLPAACLGIVVARRLATRDPVLPASSSGTTP